MKLYPYITEFLDGQVKKEEVVFDRLNIDSDGQNQLDVIWKQWYNRL